MTTYERNVRKACMTPAQRKAYYSLLAKRNDVERRINSLCGTERRISYETYRKIRVQVQSLQSAINELDGEINRVLGSVR